MKKKDKLLVSSTHIDYDDLGKSQKKAADLITDWYYSKKTKKNMIFRLGGAAGSGKSYLIRYLIEKMRFDQSDCLVVAYTGQAVNVLRKSGIMAKTIHSTFMRAIETIIQDEHGDPIIRRGVPLTKTRFVPITHLPSKVKLIICDEASFLPKSLEDMIASYRVPILEVGDPIQLPPVTGTQCFTMDTLDYFIDGIQRQEADSEIIQLATRIRNGDRINPTDYWRDIIFLKGKKTPEKTFEKFEPFYKAADITITTTNRDRNVITQLYRENVLHAKSPYPLKGERLICRRNNWNKSLGVYPLTNGTQGVAVHTVGKSEVDKVSGTYTLDFRPNFSSNEYYDGLVCDLKFLRRDFGSKDDEYMAKYQPGEKFEYAHAITAHLSQGSGYDYVLYMDSYYSDEDYHMRIEYTGVTRAIERLAFVIPHYGLYRFK